MTVETTHQGADFVRTLFGPTTQHDVFITSLANSRDEEGERPASTTTRSQDAIERFCKKWDRAKRGLFFCVGTLKPGQTRRAKENISELIGLHADIDLKSIEIDGDEVVRRLGHLRLQPSVLVSSGGGYHAYWLFPEGLPAAEYAQQVEAALRLLADTVGGDPQVCEIARLMRLPGTHNTKQGGWAPVTVVSMTPARYELDDLEAWLAETAPAIQRKASPTKVVEAPSNPFLAVAERFGFKPPIDVEQRLAVMSFGGPGDTSVHHTQLQVSASLLSRGTPLEEVVAILTDATHTAAGSAGNNWNWIREERAIRNMCEAWQRKNPTVRPMPQRAVAEKTAASAGASTTGGTVVAMAEKTKPKKPKAPRNNDQDVLPNIVADGVIEAVRQAGQDILLTEGEVFVYQDGIWHVMTPADHQWLLTLIQQGFEALGGATKTAALTSAWKRLSEHPGLYRRKVEWAAGDFVVTVNGVLDIRTRSFEAHSPHRYARRKIGTSYDPAATCPQFVAFVESLFADKPPAEKAGFVGIVQSFMGACLAISFLSREERKALILVGPSRTGKTELSRIVRLLVGDPIATPSVAEISERFGLSSLYDAAAWIRDDAINEGDDLDPQRFKTIITGEPIDIERKHKPAVPGIELALPVLLTTNALPKARDKSDAIFNRSLVIEMTNTVTEEAAHSARGKFRVPRGMTLGSHIFASEGPGILNWALQGLTHLLARGFYDIPDAVKASIQRFKDDNNPVGEWARSAVVRSPTSKVSRADVMCAYHGWQREQDGDEARAFGARAFFPRLRAIAPWIGDMQENSGRRYVTGLRLTDEGLQFWEMHSLGPQLKGGSKGTSLSKTEVNKVDMDAVNAAEAGGQGGENAPRF